MTICIAALCEERQTKTRKMVVCADWRSSSALGSAETALKIRGLAKGWRCLTAGNESDILKLLEHYRRALATLFDGTWNTLDAALKAAPRTRKRELAEEYTQSHFALAYDEFLQMGKEKLPADIFYEGIQRVRSLDLGAEFILVGFIENIPEIYHCERSGKVRPVDEFAVIGEGEYLAASALLRREQQNTCSLETTLYNVYEAKKFAEAVGSVGKRTILEVFNSNGSMRQVSSSAQNRLLELYQQHGPKPLPKALEIAPPLYWDEEKKLYGITDE